MSARHSLLTRYSSPPRETDNLPPDSQITNPDGRVILGFQANNSLNLDLDHPLAQNFKIRAGNVTVIVPDVPPRNDYIIVRTWFFSSAL